MRHDAQLDLRIVGRDQDRTRGRNEGFADAPALKATHRDVLQIGVGAGEPSGDRHRLVITGVHATGARIHHARQFVGVGGFEFGQAAVFEQHFRQRIIEREFLQHIFIGRGRTAGGFFLHRKTELIKQNILDLLRRIEVEGLPGEFLRLTF